MTEHDHDLDLSRRRILGAMGTIGGAAALGGASTMAFFSDSEEFANNQLTAGELDLKLAWQEQYYGAAAATQYATGAGATNLLGLAEATLESYPDTASGASFESLATDPCGSAQQFFADAPDDLDPRISDRTENTDTIDSGQVKPLVSIQDVKPGDFGLVQFKLVLCDNPGYIWTAGELTTTAENGQNEPEANDPDSAGAQTIDGTEFAEEIRVRLFQYTSESAIQSVFTGQSGPDLIEQVFDTFQLDTAPTLNEFADLISQGVGLPLDGNPFTGATGGGTQVNPDLFLYGGSGFDPQSADRDCFAAASVSNLGLIWGLDVDHANEIQSDSISLDVRYYTEQCRHNDGSGMGNT